MKVGLLVSDLTQFKELNAEYVKYFGVKPPVRVCVEIPGDEIIMFFVTHQPEEIDSFNEKKKNLHVQSLSFWAPPNIGPYSQINIVGETIFLAGMIGLYPPKVVPVDSGDIVRQYQQIRLNFDAVLTDILRTPSSWHSQKTRSAIIYIPQEAKLD